MARRVVRGALALALGVGVYCQGPRAQAQEDQGARAQEGQRAPAQDGQRAQAQEGSPAQEGSRAQAKDWASDGVHIGLGSSFGYHGGHPWFGVQAPIRLSRSFAVVPVVSGIADESVSDPDKGTFAAHYMLGAQVGSPLLHDSYRIYGTVNGGALHGLRGPGGVAGRVVATFSGYGGVEHAVSPKAFYFFEFGGGTAPSALSRAAFSNSGMLIQMGFRGYF